MCFCFRTYLFLKYATNSFFKFQWGQMPVISRARRIKKKEKKKSRYQGVADSSVSVFWPIRNKTWQYGCSVTMALFDHQGALISCFFQLENVPHKNKKV